MLFLGWITGAATLLSLGDIIGRKKMLVFSVTGFVLMLLGLIVVKTPLILYADLFFLGVFHGCKNELAYLYMLELTPKNIRHILHMNIVVSDACFEIFGVLIIWWLQNGFFIIMIIASVNACLIIAILFFPESPKFLHTNKRWDELHDALNFIAKFNGVEEWNGKFKDEVVHKSDTKEELGFIDIIKIPKVRLNLLIMTINWTCTSFSFHMIGYSMNKLKGNVIFNALILGCADLMGILTSILLITQIKFK